MGDGGGGGVQRLAGGGGLALAEALLCGVPVIVLAHGGARTIASAALDPSRVTLVPPGPMPTVARQIGEAMTRCRQRADRDGRPNLDVARQVRALQDAVHDALAAGQVRTAAGGG